LSKNITIPPKRFFAVSCAAKVIITPPIPNPAISPFKSNPNSWIIRTIAIVYIITFIIFNKNSIEVLFFAFLGFIFNCNFFIIPDSESNPFTNPFDITIIKDILYIVLTMFIMFSEICNGSFNYIIAVYIPKTEKNPFNGL